MKKSPTKFRGKTTTGIWITGSRVDHPAGKTFIVRYSSHGGSPEWHDVDPYTVGQYTGLDDTDGNPIFADDILSVEYINRDLELDWLKNSGFSIPSWIHGGEEVVRVTYFDGAYQLHTILTFIPNIGDAQSQYTPILSLLYNERHPDGPSNFDITYRVIGNIHDNPEILLEPETRKGGEQ